jgi:hypothetical protein
MASKPGTKAILNSLFHCLRCHSSFAIPKRYQLTHSSSHVGRGFTAKAQTLQCSLNSTIVIALTFAQSALNSNDSLGRRAVVTLEDFLHLLLR